MCASVPVCVVVGAGADETGMKLEVGVGGPGVRGDVRMSLGEVHHFQRLSQSLINEAAEDSLPGLINEFWAVDRRGGILVIKGVFKFLFI